MNSFLAFFGKLHPLFVHLPIGIICILVLMDLLSRNQKFENIKPALSLVAFWSMVSGVFSCLAGLVLADDSGYPELTLERHKWLGISLTVISGLYFGALKFKFYKPFFGNLFVISFLILISATGHLGGTLTHGEGYLEDSFAAIFESPPPPKPRRTPIANLDTALVYTDLVEPILEKKCFQCHNHLKQKGGLRMDIPEKLWKGGKNGVVLVAGQAEKSELYERMVLPESDEKHMPPKGKKQLNAKELELIHWWIAQGASMDKRLAQIPESKKMMAQFLRETETEAKVVDEFEGISAKPALKSDIEKLQKLGLHLEWLAPDGSFLSVNGVNARTFHDLSALLPIKEQIVWLKLSSLSISPESFEILGQFPNLTRLILEGTAFGDPDVKSLKSLKHLQILNLVATQLTDNGLDELGQVKSLQKVYLWQSKVSLGKLKEMQLNFAKTEWNFGEELPKNPKSNSTVKAII